MRKILIVDSFHPSLMEGLTQMGYECIYKPNINKEDIATELQNCVGLIIRSKCFVDEKITSQCYNLKFIARGGSGMDNLDVPYLHNKNIKLLNAPEGNRRAVAEHTLAMLLSLATNLHRTDHEVRNKKWDREGNRGFELKGKTIGIIGVGNAGTEVGNIMHGIGLKVIGYDKFLTKFNSPSIRPVGMQQMFKQADIISLHVPLTHETTYLIDSNFINKCTKNIILMNLSRGKIVKTNEVVLALKHNKIIGFAADVLENEPPFNHPFFEKLKSMDNVVFSPHVGGWTVESYQKISDVLLAKIKKLSNDNAHFI